MPPRPSSPGDARLLAHVLSYLNRKNGADHAAHVSTNPVVQAIASAAAGILATAAHGGRFLTEGGMTMDFGRWATGALEPHELEFPQLVAAKLLWADTWKTGA